MAYSVLVGNIGTVRDRLSEEEATKLFSQYVADSQTHMGRAGHESVYLIQEPSGEPVQEYHCQCADCEATELER